ncbi:MAG: hypothetical protein V4592_10435 [Bacteroidota bacterium]
MFNNVVLDVAIGIVFIFLLYSLLATSIQEAIATAFALRARTLRDGIINGMLCNTPNITRWQAYLKSIRCFFTYLFHIIIHKPEIENKKLGHYFYDHPVIKNYGASRIFPIPSYLPGSNFSTVLLDVLRKDFEKKLDAIVKLKLPAAAADSEDLIKLKLDLQNSADAVKVKELLNYYGTYYTSAAPIPPGLDLVIEKDTWRILQMHLANSLYSIDEFTKKLETWYDDSMNRVSGWYKRKVQFILFAIGVVIAVAFNVDIIQIAGKLSTDKDARDQMVQLAIKEADSYKNDHRVQPKGTNMVDSIKATDSLYRAQIKEAKRTIDTSIVKANQIMALGWGDYGAHRDSAKVLQKYFADEKIRIADSIAKAKKNGTKPAKTVTTATAANATAKKLTPAQINKALLKQIYDEHYIRYKLTYVLGQSFLHGRKFLGLMLTALAIGLGAPFWFDLLNKLVSLRAAGKKEDSNSGGGTGGATTAAGAAPPVNVNVNTQPNSEEAVG